MATEKHIVTEENAAKFAEWIEKRGGIAIWRSVNLSNPGASWSSPAFDEAGRPTTKPTWQCDTHPERIITDPAEVIVSRDKVVKRFHVAVRMGSQGMSLKVTDGGTRRIRAEVEKAGEGAYYVFDYGDEKNAVIMAPDVQMPLTQWLAEQVKQ